MTPKVRVDFDRGPRPPQFTGLHRGRYYYRGARWLGPTNMIGHGHLELIPVEPETHAWGLAPVGGAVQ
jgi:hypothetical protein